MAGGGSLSSGVTTGGILGGLAGLAAGAGALAIPGIGPLVAAGPLAGVISGAATGGVAGGLIDWGIPSDRSDFYEGKVREGRILATVRTEDHKVDRAASILRNNGATDVETTKLIIEAATWRPLQVLVKVFLRAVVYSQGKVIPLTAQAKDKSPFF